MSAKKRASAKDNPEKQIRKEINRICHETQKACKTQMSIDDCRLYVQEQHTLLEQLAQDPSFAAAMNQVSSYKKNLSEFGFYEEIDPSGILHQWAWPVKITINKGKLKTTMKESYKSSAMKRRELF